MGHGGQSHGTPTAPLAEQLSSALNEMDRLCSAIPDCDAIGKLRGKLYRLHDSLQSFQTTGNLAEFRENLRAAKAFVQHRQSLDPLTQLLARLSSLERRIADSHARDHR
jgi:hypothetical protein